MINVTSALASVRFVLCQNTSGEVIPAFAVMRITGFSNGALQVAKPNAASMTKVAINGPAAIEIAGFGNATLDSPYFVLYETGDGTPVLGDAWGTENGGWKLRAANEGFCAIGGASGGRALFASGSSMGMQAFDGVQVTTNAGTVVTSSASTFTAVSWGTENFDTGNYWDAGSPLDITFAEAAYYIAEARAVWPSVANMGVELRLELAAAGPTEHDRRRVEATAYSATNRITWIFNSTGFSTLLTAVRQDSGSNQTIASGGLQLSVAKLGL